MPGPVFHIDNAGALSPLRRAYVSEHELQALIARHPRLLAGDPDVESGRFVIERQGQTPQAADRAARWSVDHLFLAADAMPTVVETRWAADAQAAGDLFGQILYYAANAAAWWPAGTLRADFAATHDVAAGEADDVLRTYLGGRKSPETFWREVEANLAAGRIRMVLVVERIHAELTRMMAFLNDHLRDAEVRLLEVRQHVGPSGRLLQLAEVAPEKPAAARSAIPSAAAPAAAPTDGALAAAPAPAPAPDDPPVSRAPSPGPLTVSRAAARAHAQRDAWIHGLRSRCDRDEAAALDDLVRWMDEQYGSTFMGDLPTPGYRLAIKEGGKDRFPFGLTEGKMAAIHIGALSASRAYEGEEARRALIEEVAASGLDFESDGVDSDLLLSFKSLAAAETRARLLAVLDGIIESLRLKDALNAFPVRR